MTTLALDGSRPSSSTTAAPTRQPKWPLAVIALGLSTSAAWGVFLAWQLAALVSNLAG